MPVKVILKQQNKSYGRLKMYKNELNFPWWILVVAFVSILLVTYFWCFAAVDGSSDALKREAVALGHAEFVADKEGKWKEESK